MESTRSFRLPPQVGQPTTTASMMSDVLVALIPALAMGVFFFGPRVLVLTALSVGSCMLFEHLYRRLTGQSDTLRDLSACVTGLLLAMTLPPTAAYWAPVLGAAFAIVVVKQLYGGLGKNFMNPALAGRMLLATFPALMTSWSDPLDWVPLWGVDAVSAATPMSFLHGDALPPHTMGQLLLGHQGGCLGEVSAFMLLLGGLYLLMRRVISFRIPLSFLGTVALLTFLSAPVEVNRLAWMTAQLLSGGLMLGAFFLATDPATSPVTPRGQLLFGVGCGLLTVLLRYYSSYPEGVGWAILTMNCCAWLLDKAGLPRRYGAPRFSVLRGWLGKAKESLSAIHFVKPDLGVLFPRDGTAPGEAYLDTLRQWAKNAAWVGGTAAVMALAIFGVHRATELQSVQAQTRAQQELLEHVMPAAESCSEAPYRVNGALSILAAFGKDNRHLGYCVEVQSQGFGGVITMVVGVDLDGKVTGVEVTEHKEAVSVVAGVLDQENLSRYVGKSGTIRHSGYNSVEAVSGATATSRAITDGVNRALAIVAGLGEEHQVEFEESETE